MAFVLALRMWRRESAAWTYARRFVVQAMVRHITHAVEESLSDEEMCLEIEQLEADEMNPEQRLVFQEALACLGAPEKQIAECLLRGLTVRETADKLGLSKSDVDRRWQVARATLLERAA